ncbi:DUF202 domain-containing protein [bacterium]|nr:DUF202 domain-containing protein [bacterium]
MPKKKNENYKKVSESTNIGRIQLILAAKRTSLSVLRTGIALLSLPMSIVALLVATSKYYDLAHNLHYIIPLFVLNSILVILGISLIARAWRRILKQDEAIAHIAHEDENLEQIMENYEAPEH